jgi:predicted nucleic acid-binding protein
MPLLIRIRRHAPGPNPERGLLDTSVVIALGSVAVSKVPFECAVSTLTLAELTTGPLAVAPGLKRARRQELVRRTAATLAALPFDSRCATAYGHVYSAMVALGRKPRRPRMIDQMIAATALAHDLPLFTLNASDFEGLESLIEVIDLS